MQNHIKSVIVFDMKRIICISTLLFCLTSLVFGQIYSKQQPIPAHHWIYDALYKLNSEQKRASVLDNAPATVEELYMNFLLIDEELLSDAGKQLYSKVESFFQKKNFLIDYDNIKFTVGTILNPAGAVKTNNNIDWSKASSYTQETEGYCQNGSLNTIYSTGLATFPIVFDFDDVFCMDFEPYIGTTYWILTNKQWAMNIPTTINQEDWLFTPARAFGSIGKNFGNWGINAQMGINGLEIGRSKTGSVIFNSSFQTDSFFQLNLYSPKIRYNLDVAQIDIQRNMYIHYFELIPVPNFKFGILEGTMVKGPLEIKYLNPLVTMHHYLGWRLYKLLGDPDKAKYYGETDFCAYLGVSMDYQPCQYLRLYLLYSQSELMDFQESLSTWDYYKSYPDSFSVQLGADLSIPYNNGYYIGNFEGIYSTPFAYFKQTKDASLVRIREWNNFPSYGLGVNTSWIGSPFGPDALGFNLSFGYEETLKWKAELSYLFMAHGTNTVKLFEKTVNIDGEDYEAYYPSSMWLQGTPAEITTAMRTHKLTGIIQYTNRIGLSGEYFITDKMSAGAEIIYTFIFNHRAVTGAFDQGFEFTLNYKWDLF